MHKLSFIAIALLGLLFSSPVSATTYPDSASIGLSQYIGLVSDGATGSVDNYNEDYIGSFDLYDSVTGKLAAYSKIVFSYALDTGSAENGALYAGSSYSDISSIYSISLLSTGKYVSGSTSNLLVTVIADLDSKIGTVIIENYSGSIVDFFAYLLGKNGSIKDVVTTYGVSAIPLPPSALLFLSGILMMSLYAYRKRIAERV